MPGVKLPNLNKNENGEVNTPQTDVDIVSNGGESNIPDIPNIPYLDTRPLVTNPPGEMTTTDSGVVYVPSVPAVTFIKQPDTIEKVEKVTAQTKVRVRCRYDHNCSVGGVRYTFKKGVVQLVPLNVKKVLERADLLIPVN